MTKYIDIVLTQNGMFCAAPSWAVKEGDFVYLRDALSGDNKLFEVVSVVTDTVGGDFVNQIEMYIGHPLPRITAKYSKREVVWDEPVQE